MQPPTTEIHPDAPGHLWAGQRVAGSLLPLIEEPSPSCPWTADALQAAIAVGDQASGVRVLHTDPLGLDLGVGDTSVWLSWFQLANPAWCRGPEVDAQGCWSSGAEGVACPPDEAGLWFPQADATGLLLRPSAP